MKASRVLALAVVVLVATATALLARRFGGLTGVEALELQTLDWRQQSMQEDRRSGSSRPGDIVLVFFDEAATRDWEWLSPYPRTVLAELVTALSGAGARVIGLDVYLDRLYPGLNARTGGDDRLRDAIAAAGNVVLVAPTVTGNGGARLAPPHPRFAEAAAGLGAADLPSPFETVRDAALAVRSEGTLAPSFSLALYARARGLDVDSLLRAGRAAGRVALPGMPPSLGHVPEAWFTRDAHGDDAVLSFPIRFVGPPSHHAVEGRTDAGTFPAFSAADVPVLAAFTPDLFRDRVVLLGTGFHDSDRFRTPFQGVRPVEGADVLLPGADAFQWTYGVEVHANALQNMLDGEYLRFPGTFATLALLVLAALLPGAATFWKGAGAGGVATGVAALGALVLGFSAFQGEALGTGVAVAAPYLVTPMVTPLVATFLGYLGSVAWVSVVEGREKRFLTGAFGKYVSPAMVAEITANPAVLRLGGQKRPLSILFSDLAGFTDLSERLDPQDLVTMLNEYLDAMTDIVIEEEGGTLDKYIGDAIMAFWNAPKPYADHADRALRCAVKMQRRMNALNRRWRERDPAAETLVARIGVNSGEVVVGNVGGQGRFDYSAIGDAVNLAARLEPANKTYGTLVMTSEHTLEAADRRAFRVRELDVIAVKGKLEPVKVFEVLEEAGVPLPEHREEALGHYASGLAAYKGRDWEMAERYFATALEADPGDGPSAVYLERAREYMVAAPPEDWDFVVRRTVK